LDRSQGGLGIGLTLVHRLVELHGGTVSAQSKGPGQGSTFIVRLPLSEPPARTEAAIEQIHEAQPRRIVVVDDNVGAAMLLSKLLGMLGEHQVAAAHDGHSALELIQETRPEIVLLDIGLPGMNGYQVAQAVRGNPELDEILLVALTGYGQKEDKLKSREAGFDEHHVKPPSIDQMKEILRHPKLIKSNHQSVVHPAPSFPHANKSRSTVPSLSTRSGSGLAESSTMTALDLPQFKHDLGNVAYVLSLIGEMYCNANGDPDQLHQVKQAIDQEVGTIQNLIEKLQHVLDNGKLSH
jgi:CheY-like chemotaxis protein